jgi:hypothetical protein
MKPEIFAKFLDRQGYQIVETKSCFWYNAHPGFYFYFPYHRLITPSVNELDKLLWGRFCIGARFFTPFECIGKESYLVVCSDKDYDLTSVDAKCARRQTRRGLENFQIRQMDFKDLAVLGNRLNNDTLIRQGRNPGIWTEKKWKHYCSSADEFSGFEAWGAFYGKNLAAFIVAFEMEDWFTIIHHSSATEYLPLYPNNALVFYMTRHKLASKDVNHISYGPESLDAASSLDIFKFRMGFQKIKMKQRIIFNPFIKHSVNQVTYRLVHTIATLKSDSDFWRKTEGILRFYRETD